LYLNNVEKIKKYIKKLIVELKEYQKDIYKINKLQEILQKIGNDSILPKKLQNAPAFRQGMNATEHENFQLSRGLKSILSCEDNRITNEICS